jgi:N-methylhydantoinase B
MDAVAAEMATTLVRTSGSPVVTEAKDFSTSVLDINGEQIGFSGWVALHFVTAVPAREAVLRNYDVADIRPGDGFIANDPHTAGALHQGDIGIVMPYFADGELIAWGFVNEHVLDIGGGGTSGYAPEARDCFGEALRFPGVRIIRDGRILRDWELFFEQNVRVPGPVLNDIRSMIAAHNTGQMRISQLHGDYGAEDFDMLNAVNKDLTETMVRGRLARLPDGVYSARNWVEYDGHGEAKLYELGVELTIDGDTAVFRYWGDPQVDAFINATRSVAVGQTLTTLLCELLWDVPVNAGLWRPFTFDLGPVGTIVNAVAPAPTTQGHMETGMRINKIVSNLLAQAMSLADDPGIRSRTCAQPGNGVTSTTLSGVDKRTGQRTVMYPMSPPKCMGGPAQTGSDGLDTYGSQPAVGGSVPAVEMEELSSPVMVLWRKLIANSAGAGFRTGGRGLSTALTIVGADELTGTGFNSVAEVVPGGFAGGMPAGASHYTVLRDSNVPQLLAAGQLPGPANLSGRDARLPAKVGSLTVSEWDTFVFTTCGGGGLGDPLLRSEADIASDVANGRLTTQAAADVYGVVLSVNGSVDEHATHAARLQQRTARLGGPPSAESAPSEQSGIPLTSSVTVGVALRDGYWYCGVCQSRLNECGENYRLETTNREEDAAEHYEHLGMQIRPRPEEEPQVVIRSHFCPHCGYALSVDISLQGEPTLAAPRLVSPAK